MKGKLILALSLLMIMTGVYASAKPADPRPVTVVQPDGSTIVVKMRGDERQHFFLSEDDHLLVREGDAYYYGDVDDSGKMLSSGILASAPSRRSAAAKRYVESVDMDRVYSVLAQKATASRFAPAKAPAKAPEGPQRNPGLFSDASFPVKGTQKVIVVLVEYTDVKFTLSDPNDYFSRLLNEDGFSDYGGTGSAAQYFRDNSRGQFEPEFDLYGPVTLAHNRAYYGGNDMWGNDERPEQMVIEACQLLDDEVDFREYDRNNDGWIDNVYIYYAGEGEASGAASSTVWPHSWNVTSATNTPYVFDGVRLDRYGCSNEWETNRPDGIGTFVHEFSHVMGLPDLYATSYTGAFTPGEWSALDYGPYNNNGCTPPNYSAFERYALEWVKPKVIDGPTNITLRDITTNDACIVPTGDPNEFFLIENRQQQGWDAYIPGHGMLVWHIDYDASVWDSNRVNNSSSHQYVDLEEADNSKSEGSRAGDAFPGTARITSFTDDTSPSMRTWGGKRLELPITEITEDDGIITFLVAGGVSDLGEVHLNEAYDVTNTSFSISWTMDENATKYIVSVYTRGDDSDPKGRNYVSGWNSRDVGYAESVTVEGLRPETQYYCVVKATNGVFESVESNEVAVTTGLATFDFIIPEVEEATNIGEDTFTANWLPIEGAESYLLTVYTKGEPDVKTEVCDFTGGVNKMPKGWNSNSRLTYANTAYSGKAIPSLRLASADAYLSSPTYSADIVSMSFWHRGSNASDQNYLRVLALVGAKSIEVAQIALVNEVGGAITHIDCLPEGTRCVRIEYHETVHAGSVALDDVVVNYDAVYPLDILDDYDHRDMGTALSCTITGLRSGVDYYYNIVATDGNMMSQTSSEMKVSTLSGAGITDATLAPRLTLNAGILTVSHQSGVPVEVYDMMGRCVARGITDSAGLARMTLSTHGVFIVRVSGVTYKIKN